MSSYLRKKFQNAFSYGSSVESLEPKNGKDEIPYGDSDAETDVSDNNKETEKIESSKVEIMRALVQKEDPSAKGVDDQMIHRFLRARDLDIEKASTMFLKYLSWRKDFVPNGSISLSEIPNELAHNKVWSRTPLTKMPNEQEKFVAIGDLEGWGYANSDIRGYLAALSILQDCYPERLGKLFIVHVPYIFMTAWKAIYPFIDSKTKKKIIFVENKKLRSTLQRDIDDDQLPDIYGGKLPVVPIQDS